MIANKYPESWEDVTFAKFKQISNLPTFEAQFKALTGIDRRTIQLQNAHKYAWALNPPTFENYIPSLTFEFGGDIYAFLGGVKSNELGQIPLGVIEACYSERAKNEEPYLVALLYWKQGETFADLMNELDERTKLFRHLPMEKIFGINSFFLLISQNFVDNSQTVSKSNQV